MKSKVTINEAIADKVFDSTQKKDAVVLGADGKVVKEPSKVRKELVENLLILLQNTVDEKMSGVGFSTKLDVITNHLYDIVTYTDSLKEASQEIMTQYPSKEDTALQELCDLCDIAQEGVNNVSSYLSSIESFGNDLDNIKSEIYTQIQTLYQEI